MPRGKSGKVRNMPASDGGQERAVLFDAPKGGSKAVRAEGLFGADADRDNRRPVRSDEVAPERTAEGSIRDELTRLLRLPISQTVDADLHGTMTGHEAIARILLRNAVSHGNKEAIVEIIDRVEGKAVRTAENKRGNSHLQDQLDFSIDDLNNLASPEDE